jgi:K+-transporting ATPase ATPase C chain
MANVITIALRTTLVTLVATGLIYPLAITAIAQAAFSDRAHGSFVADEHGNVVGSTLIGQRFKDLAYFQSRPSAAGDAGYDAANSSGSNLGPSSQKLHDRVVAEIARLKSENPDAPGPIPVELVTTSGSGLDPHLSPATALWQVPRIARARGITPARVSQVVETYVEGRDFGFLGERRVNVLVLNLELDKRFGRPVLSK